MFIRDNIVTGQSLANGAGPAVSTDPPANTHIYRVSGDGSLVALDSNTAQRPERTLAERAQSGSYEFCINTNALGGQPYVNIKKGTATYAAAMANVQNGYSYAIAHGNTFDVRALHVIHGEQDSSDGTPQATYEADLAEWLSDYNTDCKTITGQSPNLKGLLCQLGSDRVANIAKAQLAVHRSGLYTLVTPKYHLPYDGVGSPHLTPVGYYRLGEYHGIAHKAVVIDGGTFEPVHPLWIKRSGLFITVRFHATSQLVLDTTLMPAVSQMGFSVYDDSNANRVIDAVEILDVDTVRLTMQNTAVGANQHLRYGYDLTTRGGNLRDSSANVSAYDGSHLYNWCVQFDDPIPFGSPPVDPLPPAASIKPRGTMSAMVG